MAGPSINDETKHVQDLANRLDHPGNATQFCYSDELITSSRDQIQHFLGGLTAAKDNLRGLDNYLEVGQFPSAIATKANLTEDVRGIQELLDKHISYLGSLRHAIESSGHNFRSADEP